MAWAMLWVPVAPSADRSLHRLLFDVEARSGYFFSLFFTPPLGGTGAVVLFRASCALYKPDAHHRQLPGVAVPVLLPWLPCAMSDLCLRGHCGKAEALLQSSAHPVAAPCPCQGTGAPQDPRFCSISQTSLKWDPPEPATLPGGTDAFRKKECKDKLVMEMGDGPWKSLVPAEP